MNNINIFPFPSKPAIAHKLRVDQVDFNSSIACSQLDQLLTTNLTIAEACEDCLRAIAFLSSQPINRSKFIGLDTSIRVIKAVHEHQNNATIVEWGLRCLALFSIDEKSIPKIIHNDGCQVLCKILRRYNNIDELVEEASRCIYHIALEDHVSKHIFQLNGIVEIFVISILLENRSIKASALEWSLRAIGSLARRHDDNKILFANNGLCETLIKLCRRTSVENVSFAESVCWVIGNMSYPDSNNQSRLGDNNACEYVLEVLRLHIENSTFVQEALRAIRNLCYEHDSNLQRFTSFDAIEDITKVITFHMNKGIQMNAVRETLPEKLVLQSKSFDLLSTMVTNTVSSTLSSTAVSLTSSIQKSLNPLHNPSTSSQISSNLSDSAVDVQIIATRGAVQWGWYAVAGLADTNEILKLFQQSNISETVETSLYRYGVLASCAQWTCHAIGKLANDFVLASHMGQEASNILSYLIQVLKLHLSESDVVEECLFAMSSLCIVDDNKMALSNLGIELQLMQALQRHIGIEQICEQGTYLISKLSDYGHYPTIIENLAICGACRILPQIMLKFCHNIRISENCCYSLTHMASNEGFNKKFGSNSASTAVIAVMEGHIHDINIISLALKSISRLFEYEANINSLRYDGVCQTVIKAFVVNMETSTEISMLSLQVLSALASDEGCRVKFLGDRHLSEQIVRCMRLYQSDHNITISGFSAISSLCGGVMRGYIAGNDNINTINADAIPITGKSLVGVNVFAIQNIANQIFPITLSKTDSSQLFNIKLGESHACEIVCELLQKRKDYTDIYIAACTAINSLAEHPPNRCKLMPAYTTLVEVLSKNQESAGVVNVGCLAIGSVSKDDTTGKSQEVLGKLGLCELLVKLLEKYVESSDMCSAINRCISFVVFKNDQNKNLFNNLCTLTLLEKCLQNHESNEKCVRYIISVVGELTLNCTTEKVMSQVSSYIAKGITNSIAKYLHSEKLVRSGCMAIVALKPFNQILCEAHASQVVVNILIKYYQSSESITQWCLRAISSLALLHENRVELVTTNVCEVINAAFQQYIGNETLLNVMLLRDTSSVHVAQYGCNAIYYLTKSNIDAQVFQDLFEITNICELISRAFLKYVEIDVVASACLRAIYTLSRRQAKSQLNNGTLSAREGRKSAPARRSYDNFAYKFGSFGICTTIIDCLRMFPSNAEVAKWGCLCIAVLTQNSNANGSRFVQAGACETVPVSMQAHQTVPGVGGAGSDCITAIVESEGHDLTVISKFGRAGGCEAVVSVLQHHRDNSLITERACTAVSSLSKVHGNAGWFGATGCLEAIFSTHFLHLNNHKLAASVWHAFGSLCIDENNRTKLISTGACEEVVICLQKHIEHPHVAFSGAYAIEQLSENKQEKFNQIQYVAVPPTSTSLSISQSQSRQLPSYISSKMTKVDSFSTTITDSVMTKVSPYPNLTDVELEYCLGVESLVHDVNVESTIQSTVFTDPFFGSGDDVISRVVRDVIDKVVLQVCDKYLNEKLVLVHGAAHSFSRIESDNEEFQMPQNSFQNQQLNPSTNKFSPKFATQKLYLRSSYVAKGKFNSVRCHQVLIDALNIHIQHEKVVSQICRTIAKFASGPGGSMHPDRWVIGEVAGCEAILRALEIHINSDVVAHWACKALSELVQDNKRNKSLVRSNGGCDLIVNAMRKHRHSSLGASIVEVSCIAIYHLAINSKSTKILFNKCSCVDATLEVMEMHAKTLEVSYACCIALYHVCFGVDQNILVLSFSGANQLLYDILQKYSEVKNLAMVTMSTMILMSYKNLMGQHKLSSVGVTRLVPLLLQKYEKNELLSPIIFALITSLCYKNTKNQTHLGLSGVCRILFLIIEKLLQKFMKLNFQDDFKSTQKYHASKLASNNSNTKQGLQLHASSSNLLSNSEDHPDSPATIFGTVSSTESQDDMWKVMKRFPTQVEYSANGFNQVPAIMEPGTSNGCSFFTNSNSPQDLFAPYFIHPSITGNSTLTYGGSPYHDVEENDDSTMILEESLRALGCLIFDHSANKSKMLQLQARVLEILHPIAFGMSHMNREVGLRLPIVRIFKMVAEIYTQLTSKK